MPESKPIEIDEILTPENSTGERSRARAKKPQSPDGSFGGNSPAGSSSAGSSETDFDPEKLFKNFRKSLPWKARITLILTRWFMLLQSKSWGKLALIPIIILAVLLAIPLALIAFLLLVIRSIFVPRRY
ncbi:MAG: hypothetical protein P8P36_06555 [Akkermansiaceae bacterium]|nr:hypothetical protein [Akkermansiaceae bacterium]